jgi:hypothetical protein
MRGTLLCLGLVFLMFNQSGPKLSVVDEDQAIPRFVLHQDAWVCLDRNPRQLNREDCKPQKATTDK